MKILSLLVLLGVSGYLAYQTWFSEQPAEPFVEAAVPPPAETVDFAVKVRVRRLIEEWKAQSLAQAEGKRRPSLIVVEAEINDIRRRLYDKGLHDDKSLKELMTRAAVELGHSPDQAKYLIGKITSAAKAVPRRPPPPETLSPDAPQPPVSGMRSVGGGN